MGKILLSVLIAFNLIPARAAVFQYSVIFSGASESPVNNSPGSGLATVSYDDATHSLQLQAVFSGLLGSTTGSRIHAATTLPFTGTAGVATTTPSFAGFPIGVTSGSFSNSLDLTLASSYNSTFVAANGGTTAGAETALAAAMAAGKSYWNINSTVFAGGEIRGFLVAPPTIACPTNKTVQCSDDWIFNPPTATTSFGCSNLNITIQSTVTNGFCPQVAMRTWLIADSCGNSNTCSQTVTVNCCTGPCPPEPLLLFNTGVDMASGVLTNFALDPHYTLTNNPNGGGTNAFVVSPLPGSWLTNTPTSKWIGPTANGAGAVGTYAYQIKFNVPCTNNAEITGQWAVDNSGILRLNGNSTPVATIPGSGSGNFSTWHPFAITSGLVAGQNVLDFSVTNNGLQTGLRVELSGTATCCCVRQVLSAYTTCGDSRITIAFSGTVSLSSVANVANYQVLSNAVALPISTVAVSEDARIVTLSVGQPLAGGTAYTLRVHGVQTLCGNAIPDYETTLSCTSDSCARGSSGIEYWLTFPGNYAPDPANQPVVQLFITGNADTIGTVAMPGLTTPFTSSFTIPASGSVIVTLPRDADLRNANDVVQTNAVHVVASQKVAVYGLNHVHYTTDAYLGLSTKALGKSYMVMTYSNVFANVPELNGSQFAIAATEDNTAVTIVPSSTVGAHPAGLPFNITMMQGQTYQLINTNPAPADLTGTLVFGDHPIAVFGSHQCANVPGPDVFFADHLIEQLFPTDMWGTNFVTVSLTNRLRNDAFRFLALLANTVVSTNGTVIPGTLNQGQFFEVQLAANAWITSDKPILVAQFANSSDYDFVEYSDPFMVLIPPTSLFARSYVFQTPTNTTTPLGFDFGTNYVNIMAPNGSVTQIYLDGVQVPGTAFKAIGTSGYAGARRWVAPGPHTIYSTNNAPFGVIIYGWGEYDAYGYPGGICSAAASPQVQFTCPPTNFVVQADPNCTAAMPDLTTQVGNGSSALLINQTPAAGTLVGVGIHTIALTIFGRSGERQTCTSTLTVSGTDLQCPPNIVTNCASQAGTVINYQVSLCNPAFTLVCNPPPGSLFPPGVTTVTCVATNSSGVTQQCSFSVTVNCTRIGASVTGGTLVLTWSGGGTLQTATSLFGPWTAVTNAVSPFTAPVFGVQGYFRVLQ